MSADATATAVEFRLPEGEERSFLVRCGDFLFRFRDAVFPAVMIPLLLLLPPRLPWVFFGEDLGTRLAADRVLDAVGVAVSLGGLGLRMIVIGTRYVKRGGKKRKVYADDLVTTGTFAYCRNPLYVGNLMLMFGYVLVQHNPWLYVTVVPFFLFAYAAIVAAEERFLLAKFGDAFRAYCADVPRWFFNPFRLINTVRESDFGWRRVIVKEYPGMGQAALVLVGLLAWERMQIAGYGWSSQEAIVAFGPVLVSIGVAVLAVRRLKKKRWIVAEDEPSVAGAGEASRH